MTARFFIGSASCRAAQRPQARLIAASGLPAFSHFLGVGQGTLPFLPTMRVSQSWTDSPEHLQAVGRPSGPAGDG
jgi:hypothetical protein